jgi:hypothetical protein
MSAVTTPHSLGASAAPDASACPVPSLEKLFEMTPEPDHRVVIRGVDWAFYEQLVGSIPEGANIHVDFDGKGLELMSPGPLHGGVKKLLGQLVEAVAQELD